MKVRGARGQERADSQKTTRCGSPPRRPRSRTGHIDRMHRLAVDVIGRWGGCHASDPLRVQRIDPWSNGDIRLLGLPLPARHAGSSGEDTFRP